MDWRRSYRLVRESFLIGLAIVIPALLTLYLVEIAVGMLTRILVPLAEILGVVFGGEARRVVLELASVVGLVVLVFVVGALTHFTSGQHAVALFDRAVRRIPGVGVIYESLRRVSDAMVAGDTQQFREVKLVEFPREGSQMLGFVTNRDPPVDGDAVTLFIPLAPNPVMAGFLAHVNTEHVHDVDMTVEEGVSAIVSFGTPDSTEPIPHLEL